MQLQKVRENNDKLLDQKIKGYLHKLSQTDSKVYNAKQKLHEELMMRRNYEIMKEMDREENKRRVMEMQEFRRQMLKEKIHRDDEKSHYIKREQNNMIAMKQRLRREMDQKREQIINDFYKNQKYMAKSAANGFGRKNCKKYIDIF